jgi:hypothetical protein
MLPVYAVVLFVDTHNVWSFLSLTVRVDNYAIEVLDYTETVAAELEIVRAVSETTVAKVEGLFAVEGRARIRIWYALISCQPHLQVSRRKGM